MNLGDLRELVGSLTNYSPGTPQYNADIDRLINNTLGNIFTMHAWSFAQKGTEVVAHGDVAVTGLTIAGVLVGSATPMFARWMEGQVFELDGFEYEIAQYVGTTVVALRTTYTGTAVTVGTVKQRYIDLPTDCVSILQVGSYQRLSTDLNRGRFVPLSRFEGDVYSLSLNDTGTPVAWLQADTITVRAPAQPPTLSSVGSPAWPAGDYDILVGYHPQNRYSPPCATVVTHTAGAAAVVPHLELPSTGVTSGYRRTVYVRGPGFNAYRVYLDDLTEQALSLDMTPPPALGTWEFNERMTEGGGTYQRIRMSPRQSADVTLTIRYIYRPALLLEDGDTPQLPEPDHHVIGECCLTEVYAKSDQRAQSEVYRRKATLSLARMEAQYLTMRPRRWVKGAWLSPAEGYFPTTTLSHI